MYLSVCAFGRDYGTNEDENDDGDTCHICIPLENKTQPCCWGSMGYLVSRRFLIRVDKRAWERDCGKVGMGRKIWTGRLEADFTGLHMTRLEADFTGLHMTRLEADFTGLHMTRLGADFTGLHMTRLEADFTGSDKKNMIGRTRQKTKENIPVKAEARNIEVNFYNVHLPGSKVASE